MGAFADARKKAREEAGMEREKATTRAKVRIGEGFGRAEAALREPLRDKAVRALAGGKKRGFGKKIGKGAMAIGAALGRAGKRFNQNTRGFQNQNQQVAGGSQRQLGGALGQSILGETKKNKSKSVTVIVRE